MRLTFDPFLAVASCIPDLLPHAGALNPLLARIGGPLSDKGLGLTLPQGLFLDDKGESVTNVGGS